MMTRFSAATMGSVVPTGTASVAELMRPPPDLCVANRVPKDKRGLLQPQQERTALAKSSRLCSTSKENFSNARAQVCSSTLVASLFLAGLLRGCPQGGRECGRRLVVRPGQRDRHDLLYVPGRYVITTT